MNKPNERPVVRLGEKQVDSAKVGGGIGIGGVTKQNSIKVPAGHFVNSESVSQPVSRSVSSESQKSDSTSIFQSNIRKPINPTNSADDVTVTFSGFGKTATPTSDSLSTAQTTVQTNTQLESNRPNVFGMVPITFESCVKRDKKTEEIQKLCDKIKKLNFKRQSKYIKYEKKIQRINDKINNVQNIIKVKTFEI
jgi:hypothetical protein